MKKVRKHSYQTNIKYLKVNTFIIQILQYRFWGLNISEAVFIHMINIILYVRAI